MFFTAIDTHCRRIRKFLLEHMQCAKEAVERVHTGVHGRTRLLTRFPHDALQACMLGVFFIADERTFSSNRYDARSSKFCRMPNDRVKDARTGHPLKQHKRYLRFLIHWGHGRAVED